MKDAPIILIDDDEDDCHLFKRACAELGINNHIIVIYDTIKAFEFLQAMTTQPFFIICDVNMPMINGIELRKKINDDEQLRLRAMPYLFWSTSGSESLVNKAFSLNIQGFFKKPNSLEHLKKIISSVINYWNDSHHPILK